MIPFCRLQPVTNIHLCIATGYSTTTRVPSRFPSLICGLHLIRQILCAPKTDIHIIDICPWLKPKATMESNHSHVSTTSSEKPSTTPVVFGTQRFLEQRKLCQRCQHFFTQPYEAWKWQVHQLSVLIFPYFLYELSTIVRYNAARQKLMPEIKANKAQVTNTISPSTLWNSPPTKGATFAHKCGIGMDTDLIALVRHLTGHQILP